jgi:hypothetical protein
MLPLLPWVNQHIHYHHNKNLDFFKVAFNHVGKYPMLRLNQSF